MEETVSASIWTDADETLCTKARKTRHPATDGVTGDIRWLDRGNRPAALDKLPKLGAKAVTSGEKVLGVAGSRRGGGLGLGL